MSLKERVHEVKEYEIIIEECFSQVILSFPFFFSAISHIHSLSVWDHNLLKGLLKLGHFFVSWQSVSMYVLDDDSTAMLEFQTKKWWTRPFKKNIRDQQKL